jgi:hypothetical protein
MRCGAWRARRNPCASWTPRPRRLRFQELGDGCRTRRSASECAAGAQGFRAGGGCSRGCNASANRSDCVVVECVAPEVLDVVPGELPRRISGVHRIVFDVIEPLRREADQLTQITASLQSQPAATPPPVAPSRPRTARQSRQAPARRRGRDIRERGRPTGSGNRALSRRIAKIASNRASQPTAGTGIRHLTPLRWIARTNVGRPL